ncbi:fatty acid desaturase family protein [Chloracidobacterium validum]|uniref:Fatty acid desaturase family protein n=1 Tax=Chloracidobacterium validum TaxID=2821543 RepID=A0ABX8BBR7_9BACT|nr:fatty acid desaturase family protein [Chloracidobacterium validum]QUW04376.1 fatty acid desaturase family protein [Chloracidobacterium validum]
MLTDVGQRGEEFRQTTKRPLLAPAVVKQLSALSPWRATASLVFDWGMIGGLVAATIWLDHPVLWCLAPLGIAAAQHGLAILAHQAAHYRMYETRWLNDAVGVLCAAPLGVSMHTYRIIHRIHHNHLYTPVDPDMALMAGYPRGRWHLLKKFIKDLLGVTAVKNYLYFFGRPLRRAAPEKPAAHMSIIDDTSPALRRAARLDQRLVIACHVLWLGLAIATGWWRSYVVLWLLPLVTLLQFVLRLRALCEHGAVPDTSTPLRAARTNLVPWYVRWWLFPHQMHYHIEHHLYPSVPHYRLPACHAALRAAGALAEAEVSPSLRATWRKFFAPAAPTAM